jgi:hypothetical protein
MVPSFPCICDSPFFPTPWAHTLCSHPLLGCKYECCICVWVSSKQKSKESWVSFWEPHQLLSTLPMSPPCPSQELLKWVPSSLCVTSLALIPLSREVLWTRSQSAVNNQDTMHWRWPPELSKVCALLGGKPLWWVVGRGPGQRVLASHHYSRDRGTHVGPTDVPAHELWTLNSDCWWKNRAASS